MVGILLTVVWTDQTTKENGKMKLFNKLILLVLMVVLLYSFGGPVIKNGFRDFWDGFSGRPYQGDGTC